MTGQPLPQPVGERSGVGLIARPGQHERRQSGDPPGVLAGGDHDRVAHPGAASQDRLDLAGFHAEAAHLDLAVVAPEELDRAVGAEPAAVAGGVQAAAGRPDGSGRKRSAVRAGRPW
nr:hypothetical protein GCM10020093_034340 [Planobispora longispora]